MKRHRSGVATSANDTLARIACPKCGFVGKEDEVCIAGIDTSDVAAVRLARASCPRRNLITSHPAPPELGAQI